MSTKKCQPTLIFVALVNNPEKQIVQVVHVFFNAINRHKIDECDFLD